MVALKLLRTTIGSEGSGIPMCPGTATAAGVATAAVGSSSGAVSAAAAAGVLSKASAIASASSCLLPSSSPLPYTMVPVTSTANLQTVKHQHSTAQGNATSDGCK
jgi:hypothetical protein